MKTDKSRKPAIELNPDEKKAAIEAIVKYFEDERDEEIGNLGATMLLNRLIEAIGPAIYNKGIADAQKYLSERVEDMYGLMK